MTIVTYLLQSDHFVMSSLLVSEPARDEQSNFVFHYLELSLKPKKAISSKFSI